MSAALKFQKPLIYLVKSEEPARDWAKEMAQASKRKFCLAEHKRFIEKASKARKNNGEWHYWMGQAIEARLVVKSIKIADKMPNLNLKRWHIAQAKRHITDASFKRFSPSAWSHYMNLAVIERQLAKRYV